MWNEKWGMIDEKCETETEPELQREMWIEKFIIRNDKWRMINARL